VRRNNVNFAFFFDRMLLPPGGAAGGDGGRAGLGVKLQELVFVRICVWDSGVPLGDALMAQA
jgi:hypothetical protein